jgi:hypothetical protein
MTDLWCLFEEMDKKLYPIFYGEFDEFNYKFWRGGSRVCLAAYLNHQTAYAARKRAIKERGWKKIVVKRIIAHIL